MDQGPLKDAYWKIVADCLQSFHCYSAMAARVATRDLREQLERNPFLLEGPPDLFYHEEPFNVACSLARHDLPLSEYRDEYLRMTRLRYEPAERRIAAMEASATARAAG